MDKQDLLDALDITLAAYVYGMLSPAFGADAEWARLARSPPASPDEAAATAPLRADAVRVARVLADPAKRPVVVEAHRASLKRALLADAHALVGAYAERTGQRAAYEAAPFHAYARVVRAVLAVESGGVLRAWPEELAAAGVKEAAWRDRLIEAYAVGESVDVPHADALTLFHDHVAFVRDSLA